MAKIPTYRGGIREESVKTLEQPRLERAACSFAEAGQLWGVTDSELTIFAETGLERVRFLEGVWLKHR